MYTALTIAGSDSSGGAGIQADIKTMAAHGIFATSAITALTAQNTMGVYAISQVSPDFLASQLDCIFTDIFPDAVKIGMTSSGSLIEVIAGKLEQYHAKNIVLDPVMVSTSGSRLLAEEAMEALIHKLIPLADLITPNVPEAELLSGMTIVNARDMEAAARQMYQHFGCNVLVKGGHLSETADDVLCTEQGIRWFHGKRIDNPNTHGTGCTLSSAIACNLASGKNMEASIQNAREYLTGALCDMLNLGAGSGPLNHAYQITKY